MWVTVHTHAYFLAVSGDTQAAVSTPGTRESTCLGPATPKSHIPGNAFILGKLGCVVTLPGTQIFGL